MSADRDTFENVAGVRSAAGDRVSGARERDGELERAGRRTKAERLKVLVDSYAITVGAEWQNTPAQCSTRFGVRQDGRMGPAVVISVVRRSRSHWKKKQRYEDLQLQEYRWDKQDPYRHQMVSRDTIYHSLAARQSKSTRPGACDVSRAVFQTARGSSAMGVTEKRNFRETSFLFEL